MTPGVFFAFFGGALSGSGGYPNRSYETVSIGIRVGAVRRPRGWNRCAEGPEAYLQITSFMRVGGRISHSSHLSGPNRLLGLGTGDEACQSWEPTLVWDLLLPPCSPTGVPFLILCLFLFSFTEMSRAVSRRLFTVFDKWVITTQTIAGRSTSFSF